MSPIESHGSSPTFGTYTERSPILINPEKLGQFIMPTNETKTIAEQRLQQDSSRGRRSTSLPGPPVTITHEDRSMSLPHSPGLQPRENRAASVTSRSENPNLERLTPLKRKPENFLLQEPARKTSSTSVNNALTTTTSTVAPGPLSPVPSATGSKRNEVYV